MIYIIAAIIIFAIVASDYITYRLISKKIPVKVEPSQKQSEKKPETPDDKASNAERLYMEGIQNVLSYDLDIMKQYLKGVSEE